MELERYEEALECYDRALQLSPKDSWTWYAKGQALHRLAQYEMALKCFDKAFELEPSDEGIEKGIWYHKAAILLELERYEDAIECYDKVLDLDPEYEDAHRGKRKAVEKMEEQLSEKKEAKKKEPKKKYGELQRRIEKLTDKEENIFVEDITELSEEKKYDEALKQMERREQNYEKFKALQEDAREINNRINDLSSRLAAGDVDSKSFNKAIENLEQMKKELEEQLWQLRGKLFKEDYEKPF